MFVTASVIAVLVERLVVVLTLWFDVALVAEFVDWLAVLFDADEFIAVLLTLDEDAFCAVSAVLAFIVELAVFAAFEAELLFELAVLLAADWLVAFAALLALFALLLLML